MTTSNVKAARREPLPAEYASDGERDRLALCGKYACRALGLPYGVSPREVEEAIDARATPPPVGKDIDKNIGNSAPENESKPATALEKAAASGPAEDAAPSVPGPCSDPTHNHPRDWPRCAAPAPSKPSDDAFDVAARRDRAARDRSRRRDDGHELKPSDAPTQEAAQCQHHGLFHLGCLDCARAKDEAHALALAAARAELDQVRGEHAQRIADAVRAAVTDGESHRARAEQLATKLAEAERKNASMRAEIDKVYAQLEEQACENCADAERRIAEAVAAIDDGSQSTTTIRRILTSGREGGGEVKT
jgi:hypothetical protein